MCEGEFSLGLVSFMFADTWCGAEIILREANQVNFCIACDLCGHSHSLPLPSRFLLLLVVVFLVVVIKVSKNKGCEQNANDRQITHQRPL